MAQDQGGLSSASSKKPVPENHRRPSQTVLGGWELLAAEEKERWGYSPAGWHLRSRGKLSFKMSLITGSLGLVGDR